MKKNNPLIIDKLNLLELENGDAKKMLLDIVNGLPGSNKKGYLTDDDIFCTGEFDTLYNNFTKDTKDNDVWFHLHLDEKTGEGALFINSLSYFNVDSKENLNIISQIDDNNSEDNPDFVGYFIYDPIQMKMYYSKKSVVAIHPDCSKSDISYDSEDNPADECYYVPFHIPVPKPHMLSKMSIKSLEEIKSFNIDLKTKNSVYPLIVSEKKSIIQALAPLGVTFGTSVSTEITKALAIQAMEGSATSGGSFLAAEVTGTAAGTATATAGGFVTLSFAFMGYVFYGISEAYNPTPTAVEPNFILAPRFVTKDDNAPDVVVQYTLGRNVIPSGNNQNFPTYCTYTKYNPDAINTLQDRINDINGEPLKVLKPNKNGKIYAGYTHGYLETPQAIVKRRDSAPHQKTAQGYKTACLDYFCQGTKPYADRKTDVVFMFTVGREQHIIETMGNSWAMMLKVNKKYFGKQYGEKFRKIEQTRSGNDIAAISIKKTLPSLDGNWADYLKNLKKQSYYELCKKVYGAYETAAKSLNQNPSPKDHLWDGACKN